MYMKNSAVDIAKQFLASRKDLQVDQFYMFGDRINALVTDRNAGPSDRKQYLITIQPVDEVPK